jgi:hypothetical protein
MANWRPWSNEPEPVSTIDDQSWRDLQTRACKANPRLADTFSAESVAARQAASDNYKNRRMN